MRHKALAYLLANALLFLILMILKGDNHELQSKYVFCKSPTTIKASAKIEYFIFVICIISS